MDFEKQLSYNMPRKSRRNKTRISQEMGEEIGNQILIEEIRKISEISNIQEDHSAVKEAISTQSNGTYRIVYCCALNRRIDCSKLLVPIALYIAAH